MIVVLDANAVVQNYPFEGVRWKGFLTRVKSGEVRIVIPEFAFLEAAAVVAKNQDDLLGSIQKMLRWWVTPRRSGLEGVLGSLRLARPLSQREFRDVIRGLGIEILRLPSPAHELVVRRAIQRKRPFNYRGGGYRDTLIWMFVLELFIANDTRDQIVFVSADRAAFAAKDGSGMHEDLLADLQSARVMRGVPSTAPDVVWQPEALSVVVSDIYTTKVHRLSRWMTTAKFSDAVEAHVRASLPIEIPTSLSTFGGAAAMSLIEGVSAIRVSYAEVREYAHRAGDFAVEFKANVVADILAFGIDDGSAEGGASLSAHATKVLRCSGVAALNVSTVAIEDVQLDWQNEPPLEASP